MVEAVEAFDRMSFEEKQKIADLHWKGTPEEIKKLKARQKLWGEKLKRELSK